MSDVKPLRPLTREHRVLATQALNRYGQPGSNLAHWVATGEGYYPSLDAAAELFAGAQRRAAHNVRAAVIADLRELVERAHFADNVSEVRYVDAASLELLIETYEAAQ